MVSRQYGYTWAAGRTYMLTQDDIGQEIFVVVTADDGNHTGTVTSAPVTVAGTDAGTVLTLLVGKTIKKDV